MKKIFTIVAFSLIYLTSFQAFSFKKLNAQDTNEVIRLTKIAYDARLDDAVKTENIAEKAIEMAKNLGNNRILGEAYRTKGIGQGYQLKYKDAYESYLAALHYFEIEDYKTGIARVNMNLGNLFREDDYDKALSYYNKTLAAALLLKDDELIASVNVNMGTVYLRKKMYNEALSNFSRSQQIFEKRNDKKNIILCNQNTGVIYYKLGKYDKAKALLISAIEGAIENDMKTTVASIGITLTYMSIATNNFNEAEKYIKEGLQYAPNTKTVHDYNYANYLLELKRKDYEKAVKILAAVYKADSTETEKFVTQQLEIADKATTIKANELTIAKERNTRSIAIGVGVAAVLLMIVVVLLVINVKRKNESNRQLTELNAEVSRQKDNVDRINRHLEEIIDERTKDLQIKNKKLAEHSSYLSHQIRGPIATLKGLMNLEREGLVDKQECINMMNKCVSEIDDKIIDMSDMLHNPGRTGL